MHYRPNGFNVLLHITTKRWLLDNSLLVNWQGTQLAHIFISLRVYDISSFSFNNIFSNWTILCTATWWMWEEVGHHAHQINIICLWWKWLKECIMLFVLSQLKWHLHKMYKWLVNSIQPAIPTAVNCHDQYITAWSMQPTTWTTYGNHVQLFNNWPKLYQHCQRSTLNSRVQFMFQLLTMPAAVNCHIHFITDWSPCY